MRSEEEIREEIEKHKKFIESLDFENDCFAFVEEEDSNSWIKALKWVLNEEQTK